MGNRSIKRSRKVPLAAPKSSSAEAYKMLRTNIQAYSTNDKMKVVMLTSSLPLEGKSTTISNLAVAFAQENKRVLLIDCDFRRPRLHHYFSVPNYKGFADVLASGSNASEAVQSTKFDNLYLLPTGTIPPNPTELLSSAAMSEAMIQLRGMFDMILIDAPPALVIADAQIIADYCDGTAIVIDSRRTKREVVKQTVDKLRACRSTLLGGILNYRKNIHDSAYQDYY